jgi:uncharacterized protein YbjQ (UPF0145 family)
VCTARSRRRDAGGMSIARPGSTGQRRTANAVRSSSDWKRSVQRVADGGLPLRAEERLGGAQRGHFTSDLSVSEFLLLRDAGCTPIAQVMGSSVFHVGQIGDYRGQTAEVTVIGDGHRASRRAALDRLQLEAALVGADAVVGVLVRDRMITMGARGKGGGDGGEVLEFTVVGTAVKAPWIDHPKGKPILTDLSGQELWALHEEGFEPCGVLFDFCRYHVWHVMNPKGLDPEFARRLKREGGASGDVRISLIWNNRNDLDLHVIPPSGEELSFSHKRSKCGGRLDIDMNVTRTSDTPIEKVFWAHGGAPRGPYQVRVKQFSTRHANETDWRVEVVTGADVRHFAGTIVGEVTDDACRFDYDGAPFEIAHATEAVDTARAIVVEKLQAQAKELKADFVIGSELSVEVREGPCGFTGCELNDLDVQINWFGTGVRKHPRAKVAARGVPPLMLSMMPLGRTRGVAIDEELDDDIAIAAEEAEEAALALDEANDPGESESDGE